MHPNPFYWHIFIVSYSIIAEHLKHTVQQFGADLNNFMNIRLCAMFLIGYAGFIRYSEIVNYLTHIFLFMYNLAKLMFIGEVTL